MRLSSIRKPALSAAGVAICALAAGAASGQTQFNPAFNNPNTQNAPHIGLYPQESVVASGGPATPLFPRAQSNKDGCSRSGGGPDRPRLVDAFPTQGAVVHPGIVVVRVTFDQPMSCDASFDGPGQLPNPCPGRWREVTLSYDRRSLRTVCNVEPNTRYELPVRSFRSGDNRMAQPATIIFSTSGAEPVGTVQQALAEDGGADTVAGG